MFIRILFLSLISIGASGQLLYFSSSAQNSDFPPPVAIGNIHTDSSFPNLTPYTQTGTAFSVSGGALIHNTSAGNHSNYLELTTPNIVSGLTNHCLEKWKMSIKFVAPAYNGTNFGFGMGIKSNNGFSKVSNYYRISFDTSQPDGSMYVYTSVNNAAPSQVVKTSTFDPIAGTQYIFEVERVKNEFIARVKSSDGLTTHATYTHTFSIDFSTPQQYFSNLGRFCVWAFGGNITLDDLVISTDAQKNIDVLALGDSNMYGWYADSNAARYVESACTTLGLSFEIVAGVDAGILDIPTSCVSVFNPKKVYFNVGSNDEANGVADATWQTRLTNLVSTLNGLGYTGSKLIIGIPARRNGIDIPAIRTYINTNFASYGRPDLYTVTLSTGIEGDGIHMSPTGNANCATELSTYID